MAWICEHISDGTGFNDTAAIHHKYSVTDPGDDTQLCSLQGNAEFARLCDEVAAAEKAAHTAKDAARAAKDAARAEKEAARLKREAQEEAFDEVHSA